MSALTAKDQFAFALPNLTYVDAHLEDPELRPVVAPARYGVRAWLTAFRAWREKRAALAEMEMMSDHELADIGLNRGDLPRVFNDNFNQEFRNSDAA